MSDRIRQALAFVIAIGMVIAVASAPMLAQEDEPAAIEPAALNADTVDGKSAVGSKASKAKRARKLVATDRRGFLPSNIVKPKWGFIKNKPAGFADGVDDVGIRRIILTTVTNMVTVSGASGDTGHVNANCAAGKVTGGGFSQSGTKLMIKSQAPFNSNVWSVSFKHVEAGETLVSAWAICMTTEAGVVLARVKGS